MSRQRRIPTPTWEKERGLSSTLSGNRGQLIAIAGAVILVLLALFFIGYGFLQNYLDDLHRPDTAANSPAKNSASAGMSSRRCRKDGRVSGSTFSR